MSGGNPYANANGYAPTGANNSNAGGRYGNPYAQQNTPPSNPYAAQGAARANPYAQQDTTPSNPYAQQTNPSSSSVNSYGSRERRARNYGGSTEAEQDPYAQAAPTARPIGGYGGLGAPVRPSNRERQDSDAPPMQTTRGAGEYGGLQPPSRPENRERQNSDTASNRSRERDPYQPRERGPYQAPTRGVNGYRDNPSRRPVKSVEEVLQHINSDWKVMGGDECVPVQMALKLMDQSSLGLADRENEFQETHVDLQKSLKAIVNEHHQEFNSSIGTYHKIQSSIQASQSRVRYLKGSLADAKGGLLTTKPELKGLATSSQELDDTLQLLGQIENVQQVPEKLEASISEKRFLTAVDILRDALRLVRRSELDDITAVADLRTYFTSQEQSVTDILIEELHDHLYLKSPYCQDRWKVKSSQHGEKDAEVSMMRSNVNSWDKPVYHFLSELDTKTPMAEDASRNPEADTFYYIHMILESLIKLGQLESAISRIEQRLPVEMFKVVEKTTNDIDMRYPNHVRAQPEPSQRHGTFTTNIDSRSVVLSDFLYTLYSKFEAIAEGHRVVHDVVTGIVSREQLPKADQYSGGFTELWNLLQSEMRSLLHDYLATGSEIASRNTLSSNSSTDVFNSRRDKNKKLFKLGEMDQKSAGMKIEEQELDDILKSSVPGLVSKTRSNPLTVNGSGRAGQDSTAAGHKLLAEASVFNMSILLPPSLSFLQRLKDIIPVSSKIATSTLTSFLDEFLINVFLPQLEESVTELCTQCMIDLDAFQEDPMSSTFSPRPIFKGTIAFMSLMRAFSSMLTTLPHDDRFTELILSQLMTYYDKCYGWYKSNVTRLAPTPNSSVNVLTMKAAAGYAVSGEIHDVAVELQKALPNTSNRSALIEEEVQLLLNATKINPLSAFDIISDPKSVATLSLLHNSMQWLASSLTQLRSIEANIKPKSHSRNKSLSQPTGRWTLLTLKPHMQPTADGAPPVYLPLTTESAAKFDASLATFRTLAQTALFTLHVDIRCGIIFRLTQSLRGPNADGRDGQVPPAPQPPRDSSIPDPELETWPWVLPAPPPSASPLVLSLNNDLISFDENTSAYLGIRERSFISTGLARLVDRIFVTGASTIQVMNENGAARMGLDVLVLQQNLRNITGTVVATSKSTTNGGLGIHDGADEEILRGSTQYYTTLFPAGPEKIMEFVQSRKARKQDVGYSYEELRTLVELCYSMRLRAGREEGVKAKKDSQGVLLRLGEAIWDQ